MLPCASDLFIFVGFLKGLGFKVQNDRVAVLYVFKGSGFRARVCGWVFWIGISAQFLSPAVLYPMQAEGLGFRV